MTGGAENERYREILRLLGLLRDVIEKAARAGKAPFENSFVHDGWKLCLASNGQAFLTGRALGFPIAWTLLKPGNTPTPPPLSDASLFATFREILVEAVVEIERMVPRQPPRKIYS